MGSAVSSIGSGIGNAVHDIGQGNIFRGAGDLINGSAGVVGSLPLGGRAMGSIIKGAGNMIGSIDGSDATPPSAPGVDPGVSSALQSQQQQAQQFRQNLPGMENQAGQQLAQSTNRQMGQNIENVNKYDNSRGLLYGGINQGNQQKQRVNAATSLAAGRTSINDQYNQAANQMDAAAVGTGLAVQQSQQVIQDQIYNQALTNMMNQNQAFGSLLGAGAMAAVLL